MKKDATLHILEGVPIATEPDAAAELVRQVLIESRREWARDPRRESHHTRVVALVVANTMLGLRVEVHGDTEAQVEQRLKEALVVWRGIASHALKIASGRRA